MTPSGMGAPATRTPAEAVLEQLFAQAAVGLGVLDAEGRYVRVNEALARMNGLPAAEHPGRTPREVLGPVAGSVEPLIERVLRDREAVDVDLAAPDGRGFRATYLPLPGPGGGLGGLVALVVETTAGRRAEAELRLSRERLHLALEGTNTGSFEYDVRTGDVRWSENLGPIWGRERGWQPGDYDGYLATLHPDDRPAVVASVREAVSGGAGYEREHRIVWPDGQVRWVHSRVHVVPGDDGRPALLVGLTSDVTERRRRELAAEFLSRASLALAQSLEARETLQQVAGLAVPELGDWCMVHLSGDAGVPYRVASAHADPDRAELVEELQRRWPPRPDAPVGATAVIRHGRSELYPSIPDDLLREVAEDDEHLACLREVGFRSAMVVPMVARGRTVGAITFVFTRSGREYGSADVELAEELGRRAGLAIDNARLHDAERGARRQVQELLAVTDVALSHLALDDLLTELLARVRGLVGGEVAASFIESSERRPPRVRASVGTGRAVVLEIPLRAGGEALGTLRLAADEDRDFEEEEIRLLDLVADRAARAIAHARLFEQARSTSATLQRSLLPETLPDVPGIEVAVRYIAGQKGSEVGGDWYDVLRLPDGRCAVTVGDVMGRGIAAAAGMGSLRSSLRAYVHDRREPAAAVERLDDLVDDLGEVEFATLALAVLDPRTGEAAFCSAGHPPPVLRAAAGGSRLIEGGHGAPIGAVLAPRTAEPLRLEPGDLLVLYTDGLVERRDADLRERIAELASVVASGPGEPEALLDHVIGRMAGAGDTEDDLAVLVVRREAGA